MRQHGFIRVGVACPRLHLGDPQANAAETITILGQAEREGASVVVFPELGLTGYTCGDLFRQDALLGKAEEALGEIAKATERVFHGLAVVGLPVQAGGKLFNVAAAVAGGKIIGLVPKVHIPTYGEFYDGRYFSSGRMEKPWQVTLAGQDAILFPTMLFPCSTMNGLTVGIEICEDLWVPEPPSGKMALAGATLLLNLSASNEVLGKAAYRRALVAQQSARCLAAYAYASSGPGESSADLVFGGHGIIAENGVILAETDRFKNDSTLRLMEIDLQQLAHERRRQGTFGSPWPAQGEFVHLPWNEGKSITSREGTLVQRMVEAHPFVPKNESTLKDRCREIFSIQTTALARRLESSKPRAVTIGISGGLDSTLALLVACKTFDLLDWPRSQITAITMPGFGTTGRTLNNALALMKLVGVTARTVDIRPLALAEWRAMGHSPFGIDVSALDLTAFQSRLETLPEANRNDLVFENVQARLRTSVLMNSGFVLGTGDLSEAALGWCTYNGDHMSMYNVNCGVPKTLVRFLVAWAAGSEFDGDARRCLSDIVATPISPELLPARPDGGIGQATEESVGPYELHDFFLYHLVRHGSSPDKILYLARKATFDAPQSPGEIKRWLKTFLARFFSQQFKRDCVPNGPKVGSVSLSPRGDWRMPPDAAAKAWLDLLD